MTLREGRWDCPSCGAVGNLGRQINCPSCARPRPQGIRFYLPDDAEVVTDPSLLARARAGADWICEHCAASNPDAAAVCSGCGAARGSSPAQATHDHADGEVPRDGRAPRALRRPAPPPRPRSGRVRLVVVALVVALVAAITWWNRPVEREMTVARKAWARSVAIESYRTVREVDWSVPAGGRTVDRWQDILRYDRVIDRYETRTREVGEQVQTGTESYSCGQRDRGNGFFEEITCTRPVYETRYRTETYEEPIYREVPVHATKYAYDIERWVYVRSDSLSGDTTAPAWPAVRLGENEREGRRRQRYVLTLRDDEDRTYPLPVEYDAFVAHAPGASIRVRMRRGGRDLTILP